MTAAAFSSEHRAMSTRIRRRAHAGAALLATLGCTAASAQVVAGWQHESASGVEFAFFTLPTVELTVRCKGPAVEVVYYIDAAALDPTLKGRSNAVFAVAIDDPSDIRWKSTTLQAEPDVVSIGVGGADADGLAREFANAQRGIVIGVYATPPDASTPQYNTSQFPVFGAADAIKAAYAGCGIKY
jgi:hypothetical protein